MKTNSSNAARFSTEKVRAYRSFLKRKSDDVLRGHFRGQAIGEAFERGGISISVRAWAYYQARTGRLDWDTFSSVLQRDVERSRFIVGKDIMLYEDLSPDPEQEKRYYRALDLIQSYWPEMALLLEAFDLRISETPRHEKFESSSNPHSFGQIYYNFRRQGEIDWAEILVHEVGHQYLFVLIAEPRERKYPWETSVYSSIKDTRRPLIGLFHGVCAQANMLELALRVLSSDVPTSDVTKRGALSILRRFAQGFLADLKTIEPFGLLEFSPEITEQLTRVRGDLEAQGYVDRKISLG